MNDVDISLAHPCEIDRWMALVDRVKDAFPGLETREALAEHRRTVLGFMERNDAILGVDPDPPHGIRALFHFLLCLQTHIPIACSLSGETVLL